MVARLFAPHPPPTSPSSAAASKPRDRHFWSALAEAATHLVRLILSIMVLGLVTYLVLLDHDDLYDEPFWIALAVLDMFICIFAMGRALGRHNTADVALTMFTLSGLWLAAFVLATRHYFNSACRMRSPPLLEKCALRRTLMTFALLAFLTGLAALAFELRRWRRRRYQDLLGEDKASQTEGALGAPATTATTTPPAATGPRGPAVPSTTPYPEA